MTERQTNILAKVYEYNTWVAQTLETVMEDRVKGIDADYAMGYVYGVTRMLQEIDVITYEEGEVLRGIAG